jgi:hypothetical protein
LDRLPRARRLSRGRRRALRPGPVQLRGYPFTTFLFAPQDIGYPGQPNIVGVHHFGDFYEPWVTSQGPHPYVDFPLTFASSYFPVTHILLFPLAQLPLTVALVLYLVVFVALFGATIFRHVVKARHPVRRSFVAAADVAALGLSLALAGRMPSSTPRASASSSSASWPSSSATRSPVRSPFTVTTTRRDRRTSTSGVTVRWPASPAATAYGCPVWSSRFATPRQA